MRFRFHRGGLAESLATTVTVNSQAELRDVINKSGSLLDQLTPYDRIRFIPQPSYSAAMRTQGRWDTHLVTINGDPMGYSDDTLPYEMPVERRAKQPENRLPLTFEPEAFQAMLAKQTDGSAKSIKVSDLSHSDAMQMLCMAMTVITRLEENADASSSLIKDWHDVKVQPDPSIYDELRELMHQGMARIDSLGPIPEVGYMGQARNKMSSVISCLDAAERQPKE
jgi:hypothetical protein